MSPHHRCIPVISIFKNSIPPLSYTFFFLFSGIKMTNKTRRSWNQTCSWNRHCDKMASENSTPYSQLTLADHGASSMAELYVEGVILLIICLVALVGNVSVYLIVLRTNKLRTITNFFILGLAAADILVSIANMPVTVASLFTGNWPLDHTSCLAFGFINMLTLCSSVLSLCNISINRYVMICRPFHSKLIYTRRNAFLMILGKGHLQHKSHLNDYRTLLQVN